MQVAVNKVRLGGQDLVQLRPVDQTQCELFVNFRLNHVQAVQLGLLLSESQKRPLGLVQVYAGLLHEVEYTDRS